MIFKVLTAMWFGFCVTSVISYLFFGLMVWSQTDMNPLRAIGLLVFHTLGLVIYPASVSAEIS